MVTLKKLGLFLVALSFLMLAYFAPNIQQASAAQFGDHVVVISMENMDYSTVLGTGTQSNCQSLNATRFLCSMLPYSSTIPNYHSYGANDFSGDSISGCSAACYVALMTGSTYSISDGYCNSLTGGGTCQSSGTWTATNFITQLTGAGLTWQVYCEYGWGGCNPGGGNNDARYSDHFPFLAFSNTYNSPNTHFDSSVNTASLVSAANAQVPANFLWYTPTDCNNMHSDGGCTNGCTSGGSTKCINVGDTYLKNLLVGATGSITSPASGSLLASNLFTNSRFHTMLYLWWDENSISPNIEYGNQVKHGFVSSATSYDEYASLKTIENNFGLTSFLVNAGNSAAPLMKDLFIPVSTTASAINSGTFTTRDWVAKKHSYNSFGVPTNGTLVQVAGVTLSNIANGAASGDCNDSSDSPPSPSGQWCDSTADATDATGTIHVEIDQVYKYLGIAPPDWSTTAGLTITGYSFYDGETPAHWEIHPVTAWTSQGPDFTISATTPADFASGSTGASTITVTPSGGFTGTVTLTTSVSPSSGLTPSCPSSLTITTSNPVTGNCSPTSSTQGTYAVTITGTGGGLTHSATFISHVGDFSIAATSPSGAPGSSLTSTVTLTSIFNFAGSVSLTDNVQSGLTCQAFSPSSSVSLTANRTGSANLTCNSTTAGSYSVTVVGTSGSLSHSTTATFSVRSAGMNPPYTLGLMGYDYDGGQEETLTLNGHQVAQLPTTDSPQNAGVYKSFSVNVTSQVVSGTNTLVFTHANWDCVTIDSTKNVNITDKSGIIFSDATVRPLSCTQSITYNFTVGSPDFTISASSPADFRSGSSGSSTITVAPTGSFTGTVTITTSTSPSSGLTPNCPTSLTVTNSNPVTGNCSLSSSVPGTYLITITGSADGSSHTTAFVSHVGNFSISATSTTGTTGSSLTSTVTIASTYNFAGSVSLTDSVPANLTCQAFSPSSSVSLTANATGTVSLSCSSNTAGSYTVTITGMSGSLSHSITTKFTFSAGPNPPYTLRLMGYDYDGGLEETLALNGQQLTQLPTADSPQNAGVYTSFTVNMDSKVVSGTNTLVFTHANWDCVTVDNTKNVNVTDGSNTVIFSDASLHPLSCTQSITYTFTVGGSSTPGLKGWSGVTIGESDPNPSNPSSVVFAGQRASNMEMAFANLTSKGLNTERVIFADPNTASASVVNNTLGTTFFFTPARLNRTVTLAARFGIWLIINTHNFCDWVNASYSCTEPEMGYMIVNAEPRWLSFWQYNVTQVYKNVYSKIIYEPLNEPLVVGTVKCTPTCPNSNNVTLTYGSSGGNPIYIQKSYQDFINMVRVTVGDVSHYLVVENAEWDGDFPTVTDAANMTLYNRHWYYMYAFQTPSYSAFDYNGAGGTYEIKSISCSWGVACAQSFADNATSFEKSAEARFHRVLISTEIGADYGRTTPPDSQATGSCSYSTSSLAFVQRMINDIKAAGQIGYTLWTNGAWTGNGIYGCESIWGTQLTYTYLKISGLRDSMNYSLKPSEAYIILSSVLAVLTLPLAKKSKRRSRSLTLVIRKQGHEAGSRLAILALTWNPLGFARARDKLACVSG